VVGGQARVLKYMPLSYPGRDSLAKQFRDQSVALAACQQGDGLWTTSLLDTFTYPVHEVSGSAFIGFAITWGVNNGILAKAIFEPVARKAWSGLVKSVNPSTGSLTYCQIWAQDPGTPNQSSSNLEGEGAFLLAGEEMYKLVTGQVGVNGKPVQSLKIATRPASAVLANVNGRIVVPKGAGKFEFYSMQGRKVWSGETSSFLDEKSFGVPKSILGKGVYLIKYIR
jgi:hypothetical protein